MTLFALQTSSLLAVCLWAFIRGAGPEKAIAATLAGMLLVDQLYHITTDKSVVYIQVDLAHTVIDLAGALVLTWIALQANRVYPIWMAAVQIISVLAHFARGESADMSQFVYALLMQAPAYFLIAVLALGLAAHEKRRRQHGIYRSWRARSNL